MECGGEEVEGGGRGKGERLKSGDPQAELRFSCGGGGKIQFALRILSICLLLSLLPSLSTPTAPLCHPSSFLP